MNGVVEDFFVCGFGDPAARIGALAWDFGEPGALLLTESGVGPATFALEEGGDAVTMEVSGGEATLEATLSPRTAPIPLNGAEGLSALVCVADVIPRGGSRSLRCAGQISRWASSPLEGAGTFRHLAVDPGDESLLLVESRGEPGAEHGEERSGGWLIRGEEGTRFDDSFVSTQFGDAEEPTRFGLELWPAESERSSRAAATRVAASPLGGITAGSIWAGLFRCDTDGVLGLGSYLLWRG
jgi:hypothetical protein